MKKILFLVSLCLLLQGCIGPCNSSGVFLLYPLMVFDPHFYHGHDGSSWQNAIVIVGVKGREEVAEAERAYLLRKFEIDRKVPLQITAYKEPGFEIPFEVITFTTIEGKQKKLYFDTSTAL